MNGDPDRLEQALQNLAANALRHTPDGGTLGLSAERTEAGITHRVRDTGPGIAAEHLPLIFDRFYKADAARKAAGGSGLGLSIVKAIVERHGGTIAARNDDGAVFEIVLPEAGAEEAEGAEGFTQSALRGRERGEHDPSTPNGFSAISRLSVPLREISSRALRFSLRRDARRAARLRHACDALMTRTSSRADSCHGHRTRALPSSS